jgi:hypothetical protein
MLSRATITAAYKVAALHHFFRFVPAIQIPLRKHRAVIELALPAYGNFQTRANRGCKCLRLNDI